MEKSLVLFSVLMATFSLPANANLHQASRNSTGTYACSNDGSATTIILPVVCASTGKTWDSGASFDERIPDPKFTEHLATGLGSSYSGTTLASEELDLGDARDENTDDLACILSKIHMLRTNHRTSLLRVRSLDRQAPRSTEF